jgi:hypothetical protein
MASTDGSGHGAAGGAPARTPPGTPAGRTPAQERAAALAGATWPDRCAGCGAVPAPPLRCGGCRALVYCSPGCQRADWRDHKRRCEYVKSAMFAGQPDSGATEPAPESLDALPRTLPPPGEDLLRLAVDPARPTVLYELLGLLVRELDVERLTFLLSAPQLASEPLPLLPACELGIGRESALSLACRQCSVPWDPAGAARALAVWRLLVARTPLEALEDPECVTVINGARGAVVDQMSALAYVVSLFHRSLMADAVSTLLARGVCANILRRPTNIHRTVAPDSDFKIETILYFALQRAPAPVVRALLEAGADAGPPWRYLHLCAQFEMPDGPEKVRLLVEHGAPLEMTDAHGRTPLWRAVFDSISSLRTLDTLLALGADVRALMTTRVGLLLLAGGGYSLRGGALHRAAMNADVPVLRRLLTVPSRLACLDVNDRVQPPGEGEPELIGATPLVLAAAMASNRTASDTAFTLEALRLLLAAGADVHATTATGETALSLAITAVHPAVVAALLEAGAADAGTPARAAANFLARGIHASAAFIARLQPGKLLAEKYSCEHRPAAQKAADAAEVCRLLDAPAARRGPDGGPAAK